MSGVKEECGVFGIYDLDGGNIAPSIYYGLTSLQHRGQESCGMAVSRTDGERGNVQFHKDLGLVSEVLRKDVVHNMNGDIGIRTCSLFHHRRICRRECTAAGTFLYQGKSGTCAQRKSG